MIYFENASRGAEGFNTHVMSWTMCISLSNFLNRTFYFDYEIPSSTPPDYASHPDLKAKFGLLLKSRRTLVSDLLKIEHHRVFERPVDAEHKASYQLLFSHFATTEEMRRQFETTMIWDAFSVGRIPLIKEQLAEFDVIEWTHTKLSNPSIFYFLPRREKRDLLDSVRLRYLDSIEGLAAEVVGEVGRCNAVHIRMGDYLDQYRSDGYRLDIDRFRRFVRQIFTDDSVPIIVATDGLQQKEKVARIFDGYQLIFIDELIFNSYGDRYRKLEFTDFNVLTILNQLLCASAERFIGTYRSTFTSIIHRIRQERYAKTDFDFFPDEKVAKLLDVNCRISPDRSGFFDWNRYSVFAENHSAMSWMREWNHELSSIDV